MVAQGNFGVSMITKDELLKVLLMNASLNTLYLGCFLSAITLVVAIPIGIYSARNPYSALDYGATTFGFFGLATPNFFFGLVVIYLFSIKLGWFPAQGTISTIGLSGFEEFKDRIHHMILPGITLGLASTAAYMRYMRSEVLDVLGSDYIRTAKAKGMSDRNVLYKHTLRNAMIPIITLLGFEFGGLLSGAIITEQVFNFPGIGTFVY